MNGLENFCKSILLALAIVLFSFKGSVNACSLALHEWELILYLKIPLSAPLVPLSEVNVVSEKFAPGSIDKVLWQTDHNLTSSVWAALMPLLKSKAKNAEWIPIPIKSSVLAMAKTMLSSEKPPLIIGSDKNYLKLALFSDKNSNYNCHQLVFFQQNRIRGVFPSKKSPWAQEINGQTWFSLIFYQIPIPGRILSFSVFPIENTRKSIYEDHPFVEKLLDDKSLFRRPDLKIDPYSNDFPSLPE